LLFSDFVVLYCSTAVPLESEESMTVATIRPPSWGLVHLVNDVPVQLDADWEKAVNELGPASPPSYDIHWVGRLYPPTGSGMIHSDFVLVNPADGSYREALDWAAQYDLLPAPPRHVFALAKHEPELHHELGMDRLYVVSPVKQSFLGGARVWHVWFGGGRCEAGACLVEDVDRALAWVAFLRE
jgi:hypothetical protein